MLRDFAPSLWLADGPTVSFYGFPYPTRMVIVQLAGGDVWVWSPIALTAALEREVESLGPIRYIVSPNLLHHLHLAEWAARWPAALLYAPPGLGKRRRDLTFHAELGDAPETAWRDAIDQVIFRARLQWRKSYSCTGRHGPRSSAIWYSASILLRSRDSRGCSCAWTGSLASAAAPRVNGA